MALETAYQLFERKLPSVRAAHKCWLWQGRLDRDGYALTDVIFQGKRETRVSRLSYQLFVGEIPAGYEIDHLCPNKACVNPRHLEAVTPFENNSVRRRERNGLALGEAEIYIARCIHGHPATRQNRGTQRGRNGRICTYCRVCVRERARQRRAAA